MSITFFSKHAVWPALGFLLLLSPAHSVHGQTGLQTPGPQDIPQPIEGDMSLAGDQRPDIVRFLKVRSVGACSLSPDGLRLAFRTNTTGQRQLWIAEAPCGAPWQLTFGEESVTFHEWSPAGEWIAYGTDRGGNEREGFYLIAPDGLHEIELLPPGQTFRKWGAWSHDGRWIAFSSTERNEIDYDIYVMRVNADGSHEAPRCVHEGKGALYVASWRPDGRALVLTHARGETDSDVYLLDLSSGRLETIFKPKETASYSGFAWRPDSKGFYVVTNQDRDLAGLAYYDVAEKRLSWIERPTEEVEDVALSADGRYLAWTVNYNGYSRFYVRNLKRKEMVTPKPALPHGVYSVAFARKASVLQVHVAGPRIAGDVWTLDAGTAESRRATTSSTGGLDPTRFIIPEAVSFKSWDGETIYGLLYLPRAQAESGKPPVLLGMHGGPTEQARPLYDPVFQWLLTRGIAVFDLNYRGSTGYGKRFERLDNGRLRPNAVRDMAAALDWLATSRKVDTSRAAVMGESYGGYMTFAALTQLPDRFKAGIGFVGVSNWVTALRGAAPELQATDRMEYGDIDDPEDHKFFVELSPITHIKNVKAPLMVLHGANDPRDPVSESDQLVAAIRDRGGDVEYLRFPDEGHGIVKLSNRIIAYRRIAGFLEKALGRGGGTR
jgi:dipeptidyl aminopeptidase/acylaminoacyl peptidase